MAVPGGVAPAEAAEIEAMFASVDADGSALALRLSLKLGPLVQRGVPPRVLEAAPVAKAARLRFADGTTVVVKSTSPGDLAVLAMAMQHGSLRPAACRTGPDGGPGCSCARRTAGAGFQYGSSAWTSRTEAATTGPPVPAPLDWAARSAIRGSIGAWNCR